MKKARTACFHKRSTPDGLLNNKNSEVLKTSEFLILIYPLALELLLLLPPPLLELLLLVVGVVTFFNKSYQKDDP